jgi:RNA polymerase sigma-70 factor (ECF subfamily)
MVAPLPATSELEELTVARAQRGDKEAFRQLVERHEVAVFAVLGRMLVGHPALVEDLAQETFLRVYTALPRFDRNGPARLGTWIITIATRLALDELKRRRPVAAELPADLPGDARADAPAERRALGGAIARAVAGLSPDQRAAFLMREHYGLEYAEIAEALGLDLGTVKSRIARARAALRTALAEVKDG